MEAINATVCVHLPPMCVEKVAIGRYFHMCARDPIRLSVYFNERSCLCQTEAQLLIAPRNFEACRMRTLAQAPAQSVLSAGLDLQQNLSEGGFVGSEHRW